MILMLIGIPLTIFVANPVYAANRVKIGIPPFENKAGIPEKIANSFVDMLVTAFVKTSKFTVVERSSLKNIVQEQQFGAYGAVKAETAAKMGKLTGAKYIVVGIISEAGNRKGNGLKAFGVSLAKGRAVFGVDIRLVDTTTGGIIRAETYRKEKSAFDISGQGASVSLDSGDLGELARDVVDEVVRLVTYTIYPIKVVKVSGDKIYLNYGCGTMKKGDILEIASLGEVLIDPDTGEKLGDEEEVVGKAKVLKCTPKFSIAKILTKQSNSEVPMEKGMIARPYKSNVSQKAAVQREIEP